MTLADDLRPLAHDLRAIRGELGMARHTVTLVRTVWTEPDGWVDQKTPIVHARGQDAKVRFLTDEQRYAANIHRMAIEVGPITPEHAGGGYSAEQLNPSINGQESFHYLVTGPGMLAAGSKFALKDLRVDRALGYRIVLELSDSGQPARPDENRL